MKLTSLSAPEERKDLYVQTPNGKVVDLMPKLIKAGYDPMGIARLINRRQNASEEVRVQYGTYFSTGDSSATNDQGAALLTLDSPLLRELNPQSPLSPNGALALDEKAALAKWNELKADKENSLYLSPEQVDEAHGKGYVLKDGVFVPANKTVGEIFEGTGSFPGLAHGQNVRAYAQQVSDASSGSAQVMLTYFDRSTPENPQWRSLVLGSIDNLSYVYGYYGLSFYDGCLAGVSAGGAQTSPVREAPRQKNDLDARVRSGF